MIRSISAARGGLRAETVRAHLAQVAVLGLCGNPALFAGIRPVSPALTAAAMGSGWPVTCVLAGCALACLTGGWSQECAAALLGDLLIALLGSLCGLRKAQREENREGIACLIAFAGGCAQLAPLVGRGSLQDLIACLAGALAAALLAPCLMSALSLKKGRRLLLPDEQLSLTLLCTLAVGGLGALPRAGALLGPGCAALLVLLGASCGAGSGALFGVCAGLMLAAREADLTAAATLALCGALAGAMRPLNRAAMSAAFLAGCVLGNLYGSVEPGFLLPVLGACAVYLWLPGGWILAVREAMRPQSAGTDLQTLSVRLRRDAALQVERLAHAFEGLMEGCAAEQLSLPSESALIQRLRGALCEGCEDYARCWQGECVQAGRLLCRMMSEAVSGQTPTAAQLPPDEMRHCRRSTQIDRRVRPELLRFAGERADALKTNGMRAMLHRQAGQAARLLGQAAEELSRPLCPDEERARLARAALERSGIVCREVLALSSERPEILAFPSAGYAPRQAVWAARRLSEELGVQLEAVPCPENPGCLRFVPAQRVRLESAVLQAAAEGETACGDCCQISELPDGRYLLALCDGMGNGEAAHRQSGSALEMTQRLLAAGVALDVALSSVNGALLSHGGECFTTLDLCVLDPVRGMADFCKLGAAASAVVHERETELVPGGRLPMGVLEEVTPARQRRALRPGETLVMLSDGVADELREGETRWLSEQLSSLRALPAEQAASLLIERAKARDGGCARDDMTVLVARLKENAPCGAPRSLGRRKGRRHSASGNF